MGVNQVELVPDANLLLASLRSVGYKAETAIADILDNCISAHASEIHVDFIWNNEKSCIAVYDNGEGMDRNSLLASMKIGSADPAEERESDDLGRFGMGMKTAAFSLGKKLRVLTKQGNKMTTACWDLDFIEKQHDGKWSLLVDDMPGDEISDHFSIFRGYESGTLILIETLDRLIDSNSLKKSQTNFYKTVERVKEHVSMIFHRFIEDDDVQIYFKDELIEAWDPFVLDNNATQELSEEEHFDDDKYVIVQPYVLPHKTKFKSEEDFQKAGGPKGWTAQQGIYIYRNKRLLVYGTWFDFIRKEPAYNLARIRLDMNAKDDFDWKIDIKKSVATPPLYMRDILERVIAVCTEKSSKVYNSRGAYTKKSGIQQDLSFVWEQRKSRTGSYMFYLNKKHPLLDNLLKKLDDEGKSDLKAYLALVEGYAPSVKSGMMDGLSSSSTKEIKDDDPGKLADIAEAKEYIKKFLQNGFEKEEVKRIILGMANYSYIKEDLTEIFEEESYDT